MPKFSNMNNMLHLYCFIHMITSCLNNFLNRHCWLLGGDMFMYSADVSKQQMFRNKPYVLKPFIRQDQGHFLIWFLIFNSLLGSFLKPAHPLELNNYQLMTHTLGWKAPWGTQISQHVYSWKAWRNDDIQVSLKMNISLSAFHKNYRA